MQSNYSIYYLPKSPNVRCLKFFNGYSIIFYWENEISNDFKLVKRFMVEKFLVGSIFKDSILDGSNISFRLISSSQFNIWISFNLINPVKIPN